MNSTAINIAQLTWQKEVVQSAKEKVLLCLIQRGRTPWTAILKRLSRIPSNQMSYFSTPVCSLFIYAIACWATGSREGLKQSLHPNATPTCPRLGSGFRRAPPFDLPGQSARRFPQIDGKQPFDLGEGNQTCLPFGGCGVLRHERVPVCLA